MWNSEMNFLQTETSVFTLKITLPLREKDPSEEMSHKAHIFIPLN